jgi:hypothetical protein
MNIIISEIAPFIILAITLLISPFLFAIGIVYTFFVMPIRDAHGSGVKKVTIEVFKWSGQVLYQFWRSFRLIPYYMAYIIDLFGNVLVGRVIERRFVPNEHQGHPDRLFGRGDVTISTALGEVQSKGIINERGMKLVRILDWFDKRWENHCLTSYDLYKFKKSLK